MKAIHSALQKEQATTEGAILYFFAPGTTKIQDLNGNFNNNKRLNQINEHNANNSIHYIQTVPTLYEGQMRGPHGAVFSAHTSRNMLISRTVYCSSFKAGMCQA